uniref:Uncharacterized protein n=1 Tax=Citrus limon TaxID=2708 RepID=A0A1S8AD79_CITLI
MKPKQKSHRSKPLIHQNQRMNRQTKTNKANANYARHNNQNQSARAKGPVTSSG